MNVGELYQIKKFYWLLFPRLIADSGPFQFRCDANLRADIISDAAGNKTCCLEPGIIFVCVELIKSQLNPVTYLRIITTNGENGWICVNHKHEIYFSSPSTSDKIEPQR